MKQIDKLKQQWENPKVRLFIITIVALPFLWIAYKGLFQSRNYVPLAERIEAKKNETRVDDKGNLVGLFDTKKLEAIDADRFEETYKESLEQLREREANMYREKDNVTLQLEEMQSIIDRQGLLIKGLQREKKVSGMANVNNYNANTSPNPRSATSVPQTQQQPVQNVNNQAYVSAVAQAQNQSYEQQPKIQGRVIRTVTQGYVRNIKQAGDIEVSEYSNSQYQGAVRKTKKSIDSDSTRESREKDESVYLPAGSFFSGVLLTGLDAPTQLAAKSSPMPVIIRVKKEAILPNAFSLDIRECHLIGSAIGDLSSERAYIRAATLSCVREDGKAVEVKLQADAVSDYDGKLGISGRLVSKNGNLLAGSMAAGFMKGISDAVKPQRASTINTGTNASPWAAIDASNIASAGALQGSSDAMGRLAEYYIQLAEQIHPVIEITPGRSITFIVLKGTKLSIK